MSLEMEYVEIGFDAAQPRSHGGAGRTKTLLKIRVNCRSGTATVTNYFPSGEESQERGTMTLQQLLAALQEIRPDV